MGLFYKTPDELQHLETLISAVGQQMALMGKGVGNPGMLDEMLPATVEEMHVQRDRLSGEGRLNDLKAFRKHMLGIGKYMDNAPYNQMYLPLVRQHLGG